MRFFIYRFFNGKVSCGFPGYSFFFGGGGDERGGGGAGGGVRGCTVSADFLTIRPRVCGDGAFPGDFLAGNCVKFLYFCSGCHYLLHLLVCLLSVYFFIVIIIIELTHSKAILENTAEIEPQPVALDFKNLFQYSSRSK